MTALTRRVRTLPGRKPDLTPVEGGRILGAVQSPSSQILIEPGVGAGLSPLAPLIAADGAPIAATGPGEWDQLRAAGRG